MLILIEHSQSFHKNGLESIKKINHNAPSEKTMFLHNVIT